MENIKIMCLIVTYNRLELLKKSIKSYDEQTIKPDTILIVNNNSSDGTKDFLNEFKKKDTDYNKIVINLETNLGGSGGFYEGMKYFLESNCNWLFLHDDDAYLEKNCIEMMYKHIKENDQNRISAICGEVIENGKINLNHRRVIKSKFFKVKESPSTLESYNKEKFEINAFSYVGVAINKKMIQKVGLVNKDFFIYYDDTEHSYRLSKAGKIIVYPDIRIHHDIKVKQKSNDNWKLYYGIRNKLFFYKTNFKKICYDYEILKLKTSKNYNVQIKNDALNDVKNNKLGINEKYLPNKKN